MFKLRIGYLLAGSATGLVLLFSFFWSLPDGKLHIIFCDVGQGDAAYIRFPDGRDMVVDGGPDNKIIDCLGRHMPFWDRNIDVVVMTHPQKDHFYGLISVFERFNVAYFVRSTIESSDQSFKTLQDSVAKKQVPIQYVSSGSRVAVSSTSLSMLSPPNILGAATPGEVNDDSLVFWLRFGSFDALFTADATMTETKNLADHEVELLKVPHHGSKTGMTKGFIDLLKPKLAVISVGKNSYGHPSPEALKLLADIGARVLRTDKDGDIEVISDGKNWEVITAHSSKIN